MVWSILYVANLWGLGACFIMLASPDISSLDFKIYWNKKTSHDGTKTTWQQAALLVNFPDNFLPLIICLGCTSHLCISWACIHNAVFVFLLCHEHVTCTSIWNCIWLAWQSVWQTAACTGAGLDWHQCHMCPTIFFFCCRCYKQRHASQGALRVWIPEEWWSLPNPFGLMIS